MHINHDSLPVHGVPAILEHRVLFQAPSCLGICKAKLYIPSTIKSELMLWSLNLASKLYIPCTIKIKWILYLFVFEQIGPSGYLVLKILEYHTFKGWFFIVLGMYSFDARFDGPIKNLFKSIGPWINETSFVPHENQFWMLFQYLCEI